MTGSRFHEFAFGIYPYICLAVLFLGSLVRFDREPYTWKSDSSQILRTRDMRLGSNLFHYGIIVVVLGHFIGFLFPDAWLDWILNPTQHQLLAMTTGGLAGVVAIIGLSILLYRRLGDPRVRRNSRKWDITVVLFLWAQLGLGVATLFFSAQHMDGVEFMRMVGYVKGIVTFRFDAPELLVGVPLVYRIHIIVGFTIFLISPFTRMVHIWSGVGSLAYLFRPYQIVRSPRSPRARKVTGL